MKRTTGGIEHTWALRVLALLALGFSGLGAQPLLGQTGRSPDSATGVLEGTVRGRFQEGVRPLPYAVIEAASAEGRHSAVADSLGHYVLPGLPAGELRVRAEHTGHASVTLVVSLPPDGSMTVDLELRAYPLELPGVDVETDQLPGEETLESEAALPPNPSLEIELLDSSPGISQMGLVDAVQALPGNDPSDPSDVLFMRGSTTDLKLVLLDGVPVFTPFHVGGIMRSFEPTVLAGAKLHLGGAPARYDGGLTHILDLRTRSARRDRVRASGSLDLLAASLAAEVPLGSRMGMVGSARSLHDLGEVPLGGERPYGYRDILISLDSDPSPSHRVRATGFWNAESIRLDFDPVSSDAAWSNRAASLRYTGSLGATLLEVTAGASSYQAELPLQPTERPGEPPPDAILASTHTDRVRMVAEATWGPPEAPIRAGLSFDDLSAAFSARSLGSETGAGGRGTSTVLGAFLDVTRPVQSGVTLRAGLRGDAFIGDGPRLAPRAALMWELGPRAVLTVAAGRYHQATRTPETEIDATLAEFGNPGAGPAAHLPIATADHLVLSLDQHLGEGVDLGIEGFWKRYEGLRGSSDESVLNSGLGLRVLSVGPTGTAWLGYGLSWFWSPLDLSGRATDFVGRHLLTAGVSGRIGGAFSGEARFAYGAGLPSVSIPFGAASSEDGASPTPPGGVVVSAGQEDFLRGEAFLRVDLEIHAVLEPEWGGHSWRVRPYLRVLNALDRRDPLFYTYQPWRSDSVTPLAERPILPVFGISFSF